MTIQEATKKYEAWIGGELRLMPADLQRKHEQMREAIFPFLRATYYRWAQVFPEACPPSKGSPKVLAVGDLHVENFGTWRDAEGRLIWGINDFDEAWPLDYSNDLIRLVTSSILSGVNAEVAAEPVLAGYREALEARGRPLVLAEQNLDLRNMATARLKDPGKFWRKMEATPTWKGKLPKAVQKTLVAQLPSQDQCRIIHRVAGLGSLGRERFATMATHAGGLVARETKALAPSACWWAETEGKSAKKPRILYQKIISAAVRCQDPFLTMEGNWIFRRLAPDCSRIELADLPDHHDEARLLYYMGWETANVHLGSAGRKELLADLAKRESHWLGKAAEAMLKAVQADWKAWKHAATMNARG